MSEKNERLESDKYVFQYLYRLNIYFPCRLMSKNRYRLKNWNVAAFQADRIDQQTMLALLLKNKETQRYLNKPIGLNN